MCIKFELNVVRCHSIVEYNLFQIKINNFKLIHLLLLFFPSQRMGVGVPKVSKGGDPPPTHPPQHLLCSGRYASCVHAGGLSCLDKFPNYRFGLFIPFTTEGPAAGPYINTVSSSDTWLIIITRNWPISIEMIRGYS